MKSISLIHTVPMTLENVEKYILEKNDKIIINNILDDYILFLVKKGKLIEAEKRLLHLIELAKESGSDLIIIVCSSLGELTKSFSDPKVLLVDQFMIDKASIYNNILVVATAETALEVTTNKILGKNKYITANTLFVNNALEEYKSGNKENHDNCILDAIKFRIENRKFDAIILSQVSMGHLKNKLESLTNVRILTALDLLLENILGGI